MSARNRQSLSPQASPTSNSNVARLAKKRATDRKSQRNHRERHRAYIRDLEARITALTEAHSTDDRAAALLAENEAIRARCTLLESKLSRIRTVAWEGEAEARAETTSTSIPQAFTCEPCHLDSLDADFNFRSCHTQPCSNDLERDLVQTTATSNSDDATVLMLTFDQPMAATNCPTISEAVLDLSTELDLSVEPIHYLAEHGVRNDPISGNVDIGLPLESSTLLPIYSHPQGFADRFLQAILAEATEEHQAGRFDISTPSLRRLLINGPVDILSFRLFHYIKGYGPIPLHWFLAIFWLQYLYLRWNILKSPDSYAHIPYFLRPTPVECAIPHRVSINMLVWPEIRQACIRDAFSVNPEDVGIALLQSLPTDWPPSYGMNAEMIASMDVYQMIEIQAMKYDFWKLEAGALHIYSQVKRSQPITNDK